MRLFHDVRSTVAPTFPPPHLSVFTFPTTYRAQVHLVCTQSDTVSGSVQIPGLQYAKKKNKKEEKETTYVITDGANPVTVDSNPAPRSSTLMPTVHFRQENGSMLQEYNGEFLILAASLFKHGCVPGTVLKDA